MSLNGAKILIVSPQRWGSMRISKHHYAIELAKRGADVHYLSGFCEVEEYYEEEGVQIYSFQYPPFYRAKFHFYPVYEFLLKRLSKLSSLRGRSWDLVLNFDLNGEFPLRIWTSKKKVFFPADIPHSRLVKQALSTADFVVSVAGGILNELEQFEGEKLNIGHGVPGEFKSLQGRLIKPRMSISKVGYSGNLTRNDIDFNIFLSIVDENPNVEFHLWGGTNAKDSNLGGEALELVSGRLKNLLGRSNVRVHGAVNAVELQKGFKEMDAFLICYDPILDQSRSLNYHKILEYLSTGMVIVSNRVHEYEDSGLFAMSSSYANNADLPAIFAEVCANPEFWNSNELMEKRLAVAKNSLYEFKVVELLNFIGMRS